MQGCWELSGCDPGRFGGCPSRLSGKSFWHYQDGSSRCPWGRQDGSAGQLLEEHLAQVGRLLGEARAGSEIAHQRLLEEYGWHVARLARPFFLPGAEREDLLQEGMTGLVQAIQTYDASFGRPFLDHATLWIRNAILRAVRAATRKKHQMLSRAGELQPGEPALGAAPDPTDSVDLRLMVCELVERLRLSLTDLEYSSLMGRLSGYTLKEIGAEKNVSPKQVENALFRARQKARRAVEAS